MTPEEIENEIAGLKQLLTQTDYKSHKHMDGAITDEEWEPVRIARQAWRDRINELEGELEGVE